MILMNKQTNKNLNLILLRKSNTFTSLSQNIVFNLICLFSPSYSAESQVVMACS